MQTRKRLPLALVPNESMPEFTERRKSDRRRLAVVGADSLAAEKFRAVFECVSDALLTTDRQGRIELANGATEELTGYLRDELAGRTLDSLAPQSGAPARTRPLTKELFATPGTYEDVSIETKDGFPKIVDLSVRTVISESAAFSVIVFRDVTEKKRMERELITKHAELRNAFVDLERMNAE